MGGVNKVILLGNAGKDPDIRHLEGGVTVASFPLATTESFRDKNSGEKREQTEWHNIVMWRALAESVEKSELKKGDRVYIEGKIRTRKWNDKDGNQRFTVEIVADTFTIINRKRDKGEDSTLTESTVIEAASSDISF
ncbi:MAG TPA: single-stranded DNA-binding protein [Bacteroidia bacterium]|jgi:single-strand DNA-binding protein|nr:single-stranded DNA-binding protein [Bacteroidia bacterium]HNO71047.1 single-stranded DNA-binding protein [Bacteroidia bacterium]